MQEKKGSEKREVLLISFSISARFVFAIIYRRESREEIDGIRPQLRDLRCDAIEQDADMICFIHRPEYYRIYNDINGNDLHGKAEIIVAKNRNGNRGDVLLKFNGGYSSFDNLDE